MNQQYLVISVFLDQGKLCERAAGESGAFEIQPINLDSLKFRIVNPGKEQYAVFVRNQDDKISGFRMTINTTEYVGKRLPSGGRVPRPVEQPLAVEDLQSDLTQIRRALEGEHPAVYGFTNEENFERLYEKQYEQIDGPKTLGEFCTIAAPLVVAVGCGHTTLSASNEFWTTAPPRFFPLGLVFFGDRAFVGRGADTVGNLRPGSEILSVNGRSIAEILKEIKALVSSDGSNNSWKTWVINRVFSKRYAFRYGFPEEFVIEILLPDRQKSETIRLRGVALSKIPAGPEKEMQKTSSGDPYLDFKILPDKQSTAILTIRTFGYYQETDKFKSFINDSFERIRKEGIRHLILDLRDNTGGDPFCTTHLLSYLEPKPLPYFARVYPNPYEPFAKPIPRAAGAFDGKLYVLINGGCFSSTGHFCALLKENRIGTFIGTETGGTYECNDASRTIQLEKTRLRLSVARITFTAAVRSLPRYRGIIPDIVVEPGIADEVAGRDPIMERALSLTTRSER
jgi:C-terminal processing protease CtpA/Prc